MVDTVGATPQLCSFSGFNALVYTPTCIYTYGSTVHSQIRVMVCLFMVTVLKEGQVAVATI